MSIFNNILAAARSVINPTRSASGQHVDVPPTLKVQYVLPRAYSDDDFAAEYAAHPYFDKPPYNGRRWVAPPEPFPAAMAAWLLDQYAACHGSPALNEAEKVDLADIEIKWDALNAIIISSSQDGVAHMFRQHVAEIQDRLYAGDPVKPDQILSRNDIYDRSLTLRAQARVAQGKLSGELFGILQRFSEKLRDTARALVVSQAKLESEAEQEIGLQVHYSQKLRSLIYFAVAGWEIPIRNYQPGIPSLYPSPDWFGVELYPPVKKAENHVDAREKALAEAVRQNQIHSARMAANAARKNTDAEHNRALELEKINAVIAECRAEFELKKAQIKAAAKASKAEALADVIAAALPHMAPAAAKAGISINITPGAPSPAAELTLDIDASPKAETAPDK